MIYPLDSAIQRLNNWVLNYSSAEGADGRGRGGGDQAQESIQHKMTGQLLLGT